MKRTTFYIKPVLFSRYFYILLFCLKIICKSQVLCFEKKKLVTHL